MRRRGVFWLFVQPFRLKNCLVVVGCPFDFLKFLPEYSDNQKWATPLDWKFLLENKLRPLIENFWKENFNQKWAAPLDLQKFLPEYSEYQKWASRNMLRRSFVKALPCHLPPRGKAWYKEECSIWRYVSRCRRLFRAFLVEEKKRKGEKLKIKKSYAPHHRHYVAELPPGGKPWNKVEIRAGADLTGGF